VPGYALSGFLYENGAENGSLLEMPVQFTDAE